MISFKNTIWRYTVLVILCASHVAYAYTPALTLETDRCIVRQLTLDDAEGLFALASDTLVAQYTPIFGSIHQTREDTAVFIQRCLERQRAGSEIPWVMVEKSTQKIIGLTCIIGYSVKYRKAEIVYYVLPEYWGKGIGREITKAVIIFAFSHLNLCRFQVTCDPRNRGSVRIIEKCGFTFEGLLRNYYIVNGECCDRVIYSLTDAEFHYLSQSSMVNTLES